MKQWFLTILLPLVLLQNSVLAQTPPLTTSDNRQLTLLPLEGTKQIQLNLVNCSGWLDCALARVFLPASAYIDSRELQFDNRTPRDVTVLNPVVVAQGEITGYQLNTSTTIILPSSQILPANQIVGINLLLKRSAMPSDHYIGAVYLNFDSVGNRLTLPLDLNVRSGPFVPLLVLLLGVILGRLMQYVEKSGGAQAEALKEVNRLDVDIADAYLESQDDRKILTNMSREVRKLVFRNKIDIAMSQIESIRNRLEVLLNLQVMVQKIEEELLDASTEQRVRSQIEKIRYFISQQDDIAANEFLEDLKAMFEDLGTRSVDRPEMSRSIESAQDATGRLIKRETIPPKPTMTERLQMFLVTLSGLSDRVSAEATLWFIKPLLSLTLLLTLTGVGLNSLYVENGKTFGARPFTDFLGLLLWGLSADVASRSLSPVKGKG
ncbi:hypothetical protein [Scytonema sp. NUACC26]|uniref:hypothetical protein n=1 Tax=Scytonema sp. NUACC26 TaxID=3140176 RepID=UPI0034DC6C02